MGRSLNRVVGGEIPMHLDQHLESSWFAMWK